MSAKLLLTLIIFLAMIALFSTQFTELGLETTSTGDLTNQANTNVSFISTGTSSLAPDLCDFHSDIPIFGAIVWGADCIANYIGYMFGLTTTTSNIQWLGILFFACAAAILYLAIGIIRGGK